MPASRRELILDAIKARLEQITIAHGFSTDAGLSVHLGEAAAFGESDPQVAIVVTVEDDEVKESDHKLFLTLPLSIQAIAAATTSIGLGLAYRDAERVLADIKRAVELADRNIGGLVSGLGLERGQTQTLKREPGSPFVGVAIEYRAPMRETWGAP